MTAIPDTVCRRCRSAFAGRSATSCPSCGSNRLAHVSIHGVHRELVDPRVAIVVLETLAAAIRSSTGRERAAEPEKPLALPARERWAREGRTYGTWRKWGRSA